MKLIIAGGGTGGHIFPAIAVAQALKKIDPQAKVIFIGTERGLEKSAVPQAGFAIRFIKVTGLKGHSPTNKIKALFKLPLALLQSIKILLKEKPDALIGVGGYASGPALIAAFILRIPSAILEPNSVPGFTNRILSPLVKHIFCAFHKTGKHFNKNHLSIVGSPLRENFNFSKRWTTNLNPIHLLILGGSQGARALNIAVPKAVALLKDHGYNLQILHQTGHADFTSVEQTYKTLDIIADVRPFIEEMGTAYSESNLIVCRSGAGTCAEITAMGLPAILIPFPAAIYDHQTENALELVDAKAAILLPQTKLTPESLSSNILQLIKNPERLEEMSKNALSLGKIDAAAKIAESALNKFQ